MLTNGTNVILYGTAAAGWSRFEGRIVGVTDFGVTLQHPSKHGDSVHTSIIPNALISRVALVDLTTMAPRAADDFDLAEYLDAEAVAR